LIRINREPKSAVFGFWFSVFGSRVSGLGSRVSGLGSQVTVRSSGFVFRVWGFGSWVWGSESGGWCLGFGVSGASPSLPAARELPAPPPPPPPRPPPHPLSAFRVSGFGFRGLIRVSGFGFWILGLGFRDHVAGACNLNPEVPARVVRFSQDIFFFSFITLKPRVE
jgi:hypothetical protein